MTTTDRETTRYYELTRKVFDILAPYYDTFNVFLRGVRRKAADLARAERGSKVLDVACGTGKQAFAFAAEGHDVTGIDITRAMLEVAVRKNKRPNLRFEEGDATRLPYGDESFDVTTISFALHDMPRSIQERVVQEISRVVKADGCVVIVDYALPKNRVGRFLVYHLVKLYEGDYYVKFIHSDLEALLAHSGIRITEECTALAGAVRMIRGVRNTRKKRTSPKSARKKKTRT